MTDRTRPLRPLLLAAVALILLARPCAATDPARARELVIFDNAEISFRADLTDPLINGDTVILRNGQVLQRTIDLPALDTSFRRMPRIVARISVEPVITEQHGKRRPGDPWTRMGSVSLVKHGADLMPRSPDPNTIEDDRDLPSPEDDEIELVRFISGFGGVTTYQQDVTALAPLLVGRQTIRLYLSTWLDPGWRVSLSLQYLDDQAGPRRPTLAQQVFNDQSVEADDNTLRAQVTIPEGLATPRLRILSTGHATDGTDGDEFTARTNVLRVDGEVIAMFRPWSEGGGMLRHANPTSGRITIAGRTLWSSDLDRAGWHPGLVVEPRFIPLPELTPGEHTIEYTVRNIRPEDADGELGYWRVSAILVADQPWPEPADASDQ